MGLFDDIPDAPDPVDLFADLPNVQPTTNATPALPAGPEMVAPALPALPEAVLPAAPVPAMPVDPDISVAPLFQDMPPAPDFSTDHQDLLAAQMQVVPEAMRVHLQRRLEEFAPPAPAPAPAAPTDLDRAHAEFEERSLVDVTADRLRKGSNTLGGALSTLTASESADIVAALDAADALDARGADLQEYADLADRHSRLNLNTIMDPAARGEMRERYLGRAGEAAASAVDNFHAAGQFQNNPVSDAMLAELSANGLTGEAWELFKKDPLGIIGQLGTETLPMAAAVAGSGAVGGPGAGGAMGYGLERGSSIFDALSDAGIDTGSPDAVLAGLQNPETRQKAEEFAAKRGVPIAIFDALTLGLGRLTTTPGRQVASQLTAEPAAEMAGEAAAQKVSTGKLDLGEIAAEGIGGVGGGAVQAGTEIARQSMQRAPQPPETPQDGPEQLPQSPETPLPVGPGDEGGSAGRDALPEMGRDAGPVGPEGPDVAENQAGPDAASEPQGDLNASQDVPPEPTPADETPAPRPERRATVYTPENDPVEVEYQVVEADAVLTSDQQGFDQSAQPRDRQGNKNSEIQIESIANNPIFGRLYRAPETDRGAPIVGADGLVESGNGRTMALRRAYERGTAAEYRKGLETEFPEAAGMKAPIVIARRITDVNREQFAYQSNKAATQALSAVEEARAEAKMVDSDILGLYRGGPVTSAGNRDMVKAFIGKLPKTDQNRMLNPDGGLSVDGMRRVQAAVFSRAYDSPELLSRMAESVDDDMRGLTGVLTDVAPRVAQMRVAMEKGEIAADGDFVPALIEAIDVISNFRSRGENLSDYKAQIDAFAAPVSEEASIIMDAMFNPAGTRLASKKAVQDFIEFAIDGAQAQDTTTETLPGVEPVPPKKPAEIVKDAKRKTETDQEQTALFDRAGEPGQRAGKGRKEEQRAPDGGRRREDAGSGQQSLADAAAAKVGRRPPGRLSPTFLEHSYTNKASIFDHAFVDAGIDPADGRLMPMDEQLRVVSKAVENRFGIKVALPKINVSKKNLAGRRVTEQKTSLQSRKALDQLLNAYRQLQMLAHIMGMPEKGLALKIDGKPLTLSLVKGKHLRGALGMFSYGGGQRTISLADMSNSFAHEWGHALDHWLGMSADSMISRDMAGEGVTAPNTPKRQLTRAFAHIMWSMYGDSAAAGKTLLDIQMESAQVDGAGNPTSKAQKAQKILKDIEAGRKPPKEYWSKYVKSSAEYDRQIGADGYFTDPAEMFARAFEAYVGTQVAGISDQPQAFLSKGEWAYSDKTDHRAAMTFPKDVDLAQFSVAMAGLQHAMARTEIHGPAAPASAPETHDIMTTRHLLKDNGGGLSGLSQRERAEWSRTLDIMGKAPSIAKDKADSIKSGVGAFYSHALRTTAATMYAVADRQATPEARAAFTNIAKMVGKRPGNGKLIENIWEENVRRKTAVYVNKVDGALKKAASASRAFRLSKDQQKTLRALMLDNKVEASPALRRLASDLRAILNDIWYDLDGAGVEMGYASNYLPHRYDPNKATAEPAKFKAQAAKVYDLMFQREIVDNDDADGQLADMKAITRGLQKAVQALPDGDVTPRPRLSSKDAEKVFEYFDAMSDLKKAKKSLEKVKTDEAKERWQAKIDDLEAGMDDLRADALDILRKGWAEHSAEKWLTKIRTGNLDDFGSIGPTASFLEGRKLPKEAGEFMAEFMEENPVEMVTAYAMDAMRRAEYAKAFGASNEKLENMLMSAEGASREDVELMKQAVAAATGRINRSMSGIQSLKSTTFSAGTMGMLSLATMSSLAEPLTAGIRSAQVRDSFRAMVEFFRNLPPSSRKRDLKELARTIGLVMPYTMDTLMQNRMGMDVLDNKHWLNQSVSRYFILNGLTPLTHYQRTAMVPVANAVILRHLRANVEGKRGIYGRMRDAVDGKAKGFSDGELNELGIAQEGRADLLKWLDSVGGMPSPEDMFGPDGDFHKAAELWARAVTRFSTETVQDTLKSDRPMAANDPNHAALYGIMSFIDAFTRNVIFRTLERGIKDGDSRVAKTAKVGANVSMAALPVLTLVMGQIITGALREFIFNNDELEEKIEEGEAVEWLIKRGVDRSGLTGRLQPFVNLVTGVRYETDMTSLFAGPYLVYFLGNIQRMLAAQVGRNSPNTNSSEFAAAEGLYRTMVKVPLTALISGVAPGGPVSSNAARALIGWMAMGTTEDAFAEALVGEKGSKHEGDPPWWELGD